MDRGRVYRANYEDCRAEASKATSASSKAQWLVFAEEWLKQAEAAEDQQRREAAISVVAPASKVDTSCAHPAAKFTRSVLEVPLSREADGLGAGADVADDFENSL